MKIIFFILLLTFPFLSLAQNVSGSVQDFHFNTPLEEVSITIKDNSNGEILGTDSTDASGNYSVDYKIVGVNENSSIPDDYHLSNAYPQPFNPSARIDFNTPVQGRFTARIYNVIGQLVYSKDFTVDAGNHSFSISGLGSAGVYLFNLSSDNFTSTQKLMQLDGGSSNTNVDLIASNHSLLKKSLLEELLIEFRKNGYFEKDTVISWQMNLTVDAEIKQVPNVDTIWFYTSQNLIPTNTPANNASVVGSANGSQIFSGVTNSNGEFETNFIAQYITNPNDTTEKVYTPGLILVNVSRTNAVGESQEFVVDGSDITWMNDLQQTLINKNGSASGIVQNEISQPVNNANVKLYNNDNNQFFGQGNTNVSGDYQINFVYQGYENDPGDEHTPVNDLRLEASAQSHESETIIKPFQNPVITDFVLNRVAYTLNAIIKLYNTKGDIITDLDSLKFIWPDGNTEMIPNNNGVVTLNKLIYTLNSDTTAFVTHNHPELYLNWIIGTTNNAEKVEWLYQNQTPWSTNNSKIPLNKINIKTTEQYLIPRFANYGPNNNLQIDMSGPIVTGFLSRGPFGMVSGFRPVPNDTTYIYNTTFNRDTGLPVAQNDFDRKTNELYKFLTAADSWSHKKLLLYAVKVIDSLQDPHLQWVLFGPRNGDNYSFTGFYNGGPGNSVNLSLEIFKMKNSISEYNTGNSFGQIQEEIFCSMTNTNIDGADYLLAVNIAGVPYTDLARHLIGISLIMKPGTYYWE